MIFQIGLIKVRWASDFCLMKFRKYQLTYIPFVPNPHCKMYLRSSVAPLPPVTVVLITEYTELPTPPSHLQMADPLFSVLSSPLRSANYAASTTMSTTICFRVLLL